jgi:hypothetical protein
MRDASARGAAFVQVYAEAGAEPDCLREVHAFVLILRGSVVRSCENMLRLPVRLSASGG